MLHFQGHALIRFGHTLQLPGHLLSSICYVLEGSAALLLALRPASWVMLVPQGGWCPLEAAVHSWRPSQQPTRLRPLLPTRHGWKIARFGCCARSHSTALATLSQTRFFEHAHSWNFHLLFIPTRRACTQLQPSCTDKAPVLLVICILVICTASDSKVFLNM